MNTCMVLTLMGILMNNTEKSTSLTHVADGTWRYTISLAIEAVGADWKHKKKYKWKQLKSFNCEPS